MHWSGGELAREAAAVAEEEADGEFDLGLPGSIPSTWMQRETRRSKWWCSICFGRPQSTAASTAAIAVCGGEENRGEEKGGEAT